MADNQPKVMVVDDNLGMRITLEAILENQGYQGYDVVGVDDVYQAIELARETVLLQIISWSGKVGDHLFDRQGSQDRVTSQPVLCVRWYLRSSLSYRDLEEMMASGSTTPRSIAGSRAMPPS